MALTRALARDHKVTKLLLGFTARRLSLSVPGLPQRTKVNLDTSKKEKELAVETDVEILKTEVCGTNLFVEGGENIKLKPDSEYPDWLWELHLGKPLDPHELDPNTKKYWERVMKLGREREKILNKYIPRKRDYK